MSPAAICLAPVGSAAPLGSRIQILLLPHHSSRIDATISFGSGCRRAFGGEQLPLRLVRGDATTSFDVEHLVESSTAPLST